MGFGNQLFICIKKHWILKKRYTELIFFICCICCKLHSIITFRQPISFLLQLFFPVILISVLLLLKLAIPEGNNDICQVILIILNTISIILFIFQSSEPEPHQALDLWPVFSRICATFRMTAMTLKILRFVDENISNYKICVFTPFSGHSLLSRVQAGSHCPSPGAPHL